MRPRDAVLRDVAGVLVTLPPLPRCPHEPERRRTRADGTVQCLHCGRALDAERAAS